MGRPSRSRANAGFLLTETLATFIISAFVLLGLVSASTVLLHAVDRSVARVQDVDGFGRTMEAITRDVSGLARARWDGLEPESFVFRGGPNSMIFALTRHGPEANGETIVIALREIVGAEGPILTRSEAALPATARRFDDLRFAPPHPLDTGVARLRFSYVAAVGGREEKKREWTNGSALPAAIIIEAIKRDTGRLLVSMHVLVHANADIGCLEEVRNAPVVASEGRGAQSDSFCGRSDRGDKTGRTNAASQLGRPDVAAPEPSL